MDEDLTEKENAVMQAAIRAARVRSAGAKEFDDWLESVERRLNLMADEVGADLALRKILGMMMISHAMALMRTMETQH